MAEGLACREGHRVGHARPGRHLDQQVPAREQRSGKEATIQVIPSHGLTREEVARIETESIAFARQDMTAHRLIDLRNAGSIVFRSKFVILLK